VVQNEPDISEAQRQWQHANSIWLDNIPAGNERSNSPLQKRMSALYPVAYTEAQVSLLQRTMEYDNAAVLTLCR
jgi:hypothetical protein